MWACGALGESKRKGKGKERKRIKGWRAGRVRGRGETYGHVIASFGVVAVETFGVGVFRY